MRPQRYQLRDYDAFLDAQKDTPEWLRQRAETLIKRQGPVPQRDLDAYFAAVKPNTPKAWVARHRTRMATLGTGSDTEQSSPEFKSVEEFQWAIGYSAEQNVLQPEGLDQGDWEKQYLSHMAADVGAVQIRWNGPKGEWFDKMQMYTELKTNVPFGTLRDHMRKTAAAYKFDGLPELDKDKAPDAWKQRLRQTLANRHTPALQPGVKSSGEFQWAVGLLARAGFARAMGREPEPKDIAPQQKGPDIGPDLGW